MDCSRLHHVGLFNSSSKIYSTPFFSDNGPVRSLAGATDADDTMTIENCLSFCSPFIFAGVEFGVSTLLIIPRYSVQAFLMQLLLYRENVVSIAFPSNCVNSFFFFEIHLTFALGCTDCANTITPGTTNATATDCDMPCAANANEPCGAGDRINLFWNGTTPPLAPTVKPSVGSWVSLGCYTYV